jgi:5'-nucleotidase
MTENTKPLILVTNDDGVDAQGLRCLTEAIRPLGEIVVMAPDGPRSGMSGAFTFTRPLTFDLRRQEPGLTVYACSGTPVDCVKLACHNVLDRKPDILLSGCNHGINAAICVFYSATVGAMFEGCILGIPSIAVSLCNHEPAGNFANAVFYAKKVTEKVLEEGLPKGTCINLNIPDVEKVKGMKVCSGTDSRWIKETEKRFDSAGREVYWLTGELLNDEPHNRQTDLWALDNGYAALVPLKIDMTDYESLKKMKNWEI